ncbi:hypothetical protein M9434_000742 [Picochlorum sp. BPE23]|nr:hypothetical protein M9434_000742 [Picochlorum sp. BPE23]
METSSQEAKVPNSSRIRIFRKTLLEECLLVAEVINENDRYRCICESIRRAWGLFEELEGSSSMGRRREGRDALCQRIVSECLDEPVRLCEDVCTSECRDDVYERIRHGLRSVVEEAVREVEALHKVLRRLHHHGEQCQHDESSRKHHGFSPGNTLNNDHVLPETPGQDIWRPLSMEDNNTSMMASTEKKKKKEKDHQDQQQQEDDDDDDRVDCHGDNNTDDAKMHDEIMQIVDEYFRQRLLTVHLVDLGGGFSSDKELSQLFTST